jgi:hypothetical protein
MSKDTMTAVQLWKSTTQRSQVNQSPAQRTDLHRMLLEFLHQRNTESGSLSGTGAGHRSHIGTRQNEWDGFALNRRRDLHEAE